MLDIFNTVDALLLTAVPNKRYVSGFTGSACLVAVLKEKILFVTDGRYKTQIKSELYDNVEAHVQVAGQSALDLMLELLEKENITKLGVEANDMTVSMYQDIEKRCPNYELVSTVNVIEKVREVKTEEELDVIKAAVKITDQAFAYIIENIKPGMTEIEVKNMANYAHGKFGGEKPSFDAIVASGPNSALPHANPTDRVIEDGDIVTIDFGTFYNGYASDMTRTFFVGSATNEKLIEIHNTVHKAWETQIAAARAGISGHDLDSIGRDIITEAGYGEYFIHSTGHAVGLEVHENPRVAQGWDQKLVAGNVVTIEPGIYIEGIGGVRIENDIVITDEGCISLNESPTNYDVAIKG